MALLLSILALVAGPFVYALGRRQPDLRQILDGFVFITIAGIVCVFIVPKAIDAGGPFAIAFALLGLAFPVAIERFFDSAMHEAHVFILVLAALGLVVHATLDGIALLPLNEADVDYLTQSSGLFGSLFDNQLALGVILHRLPVGMAIWWSVRTSFGRPVAIGTFAAIILATTVAYLQGQEVMALAAAPSVAYFQAFVSGSLVHVVAFGVSHDHHEHAQTAKTAEKAWAYRVGILLGMFVVFTAPHLHP
jgi:hypothetical protein